VALAVLWALIPGVFAPGDPLTGTPADKLLPPSAAHWFGTDTLGRDLFGRVVHGAVHSLSGALIAVTVGLALGTLLGAIAGALGGVVDDILMRVVDVLLAIPGLLLSLSVIILLGFGTVNAAIAVGLGSVAAFARLMRSEVARVRRSEYVEAAYGSGGTFFTVLRRHVLPNSLTPIVGADPVAGLILPVLTLAVPISAPLAQVLVRAIDQVQAQPFITVVRAKGAPPSWVLTRSVARNAALPTLTIAGVLFGELVGGAVVTETVFGRTGIGRLTEQAVSNQDIPVLQGVVLLSALGFVLISFAVDLVTPLIDPRQRALSKAGVSA
jgi:ABC-type dipeptide/oligopeptide/nickel transport system permease component